jgi:hypothetical protein
MKTLQLLFPTIGTGHPRSNHQNFKNDQRVVFFAELRAVTYEALATVSIALAVLACGDQKRNPIPKIPRTAVMATA